MSRKILMFDKEFNDFVESFIEYDEAIPVLENNGINKDDILAYHSLAKHANIYTYKNQQLVSYTIDKEKITSTYTYTFNHDIEIIKETIISDSYYDLSFYAYQDDQLSYYRFNFQFDENNNSITKLEGNETFIAKKDQPFDEAYLQQLIKAYNYYNYNSLETKDYLFTSDLDYIQAVVLSENKDKYDYTGLQIDLYSPMNYIGAFRILGDYDENIQIKQIDNQVIIGPIQVNAQEGTSYTYEKIITIYDDYCEESANIL